MLQTLLFEIGPRDWTTLVLVTSFLAVVSAAACLVPARRAARIDPVAALKQA
jgi:ABC-type lipoprotein release transport system permease subunit